jgi:hypothetical protein
MSISSRTLFHFTPKIDYLKDILQNGFWPRYCREYGWGNKYVDFAVPMVCFCDIPLTQISEHSKFYGGFGIGVSPTWIRSHKTITPVQYVAANSWEFNSMNRILTKLKNGNISQIELQKLVLAKKVSGIAINKDGKKSKKKFYNEREWRYVPDCVDQMAIPIGKKEEFDSTTLSNETKDHRLTVDIDSIRYLFIPSESYRAKAIQMIRDVYKGIAEPEQLILMSKIITIEQIKDDF